jgi:hypothetical protein
MDIKKLKNKIVDDNYLKDADEINWEEVHKQIGQFLVDERVGNFEDNINDTFKTGKTYKIVDFEGRLLKGANVVYLTVSDIEINEKGAVITGSLLEILLDAKKGSPSNVFGLRTSVSVNLLIGKNTSLEHSDGSFGIHELNDFTIGNLQNVYPAIVQTITQLFQLNPQSEPQKK